MVFLEVPMLGGLSLLRNLVDHSKKLSVELFKSSSQFLKVAILEFLLWLRCDTKELTRLKLVGPAGLEPVTKGL